MSEPLFYLATGEGIISSRTGWGTADTQVLFRAGRTSQSHSDRAQGSVLISRDNTWLAGTAKLGSHSGIAQDCWDWNTLSVTGPNGPLPQTWTQDGVKILRQEDNAQYTYAIADITAAYQNQLSVFIREILFLKPLVTGGSAYLLIADGFVPISPASQVVWHLNTLAQPVIGVTLFKAGRLYGQVVEPFPNLLAAETVTVGQDHPTYRINLTGDSTGHFLVALEAAAPVQLSGTTLGQPYVAGGVQGIRCGDAFAAWLAGERTTWTYLSQTTGPHYLMGSPNTVYQTPAGTLTSSAVGVLTFPGPPVGQSVTITRGTTPIPTPIPPIPTPIPPPKAYTVSGTLQTQADGTLTGSVTLVPK